MAQRVSTVLVLACTLALGGCATRWVVDSQVRSFSELPADAATQAPVPYRFERLPLQQQGPEAARQTDALEAFAMPALDAAGLRRDDAAARYSVQIGARVTRVISPWDDPWLNGGWGGWGGFGYGRPYYGGYGGYGGWGRRGGFGAWGGGFGGFPPMANPWYAREVSVVMRDLGTQRVVYETHARNDGPYSGDAAVLPAMFQAALRGFPTPPQGVRRVDVEVQRAGASASAAR
jgi:hypothetical protein